MYEHNQGPNESVSVDILADVADSIQQSKDMGIREFEERLESLERYLTDKYLVASREVEEDEDEDAEGYVDHDELLTVVSELNGEWSNCCEVATVSGYIYLYDSESEGYVPPEWGEAFVDEYGATYYVVNDIKLRSIGVTIIMSENVDEELERIRPAYAFTLPGELEHEEPFVHAYVNDLYRHEYSQPTANEAKYRLKEKWKKQFNFIEKKFTGNTEEPWYKKAQSVVAQLQSDLVTSPEMRRYVEAYFRAHAAFDVRMPYFTAVEGEIEMCTTPGANVYLDGEDVSWQKLHITDGGETSLFGNNPKIQLVQRENGEIECVIIQTIFSSPTNNDELDIEQIRINIANIRSFWSTMTARSIASRAIFDASFTELPADEPGSTIGHDVRPHNEQSSYLLAEMDQPDSLESREVPEYIEQLMLLEWTLQSTTELVKQEKKTLYPTLEKADEATLQLLANKTIETHLEILSSYKPEVTVVGEAIMVPKSVSDMTFGGAEKNTIDFTYSLDAEGHVRPLDTGDSRIGLASAIVSGNPSKHVDQDGDVIGYRVNPVLLVQMQTKTFTPLTLQDAMLERITLDSMALVPLDGTAEITLRTLDNYREADASIDILESKGVHLEVIRGLRMLQYQACEARNNPQFVEFNAPELFAQLEYLTNAASDVGRVLEKTFLERMVKIEATETYRYEEGEFISLPKGYVADVARGAVVDVRTDIQPDRVFIALKTDSDSDVIYIPAGAITQLSF